MNSVGTDTVVDWKLLEMNLVIDRIPDVTREIVLLTPLLSETAEAVAATIVR